MNLSCYMPKSTKISWHDDDVMLTYDITLSKGIKFSIPIGFNSDSLKTIKACKAGINNWLRFIFSITRCKSLNSLPWISLPLDFHSDLFSLLRNLSVVFEREINSMSSCNFSLERDFDSKIYPNYKSAKLAGAIRLKLTVPFSKMYPFIFRSMVQITASLLIPEYISEFKSPTAQPQSNFNILWTKPTLNINRIVTPCVVYGLLTYNGETLQTCEVFNLIRRFPDLSTNLYSNNILYPFASIVCNHHLESMTDNFIRLNSPFLIRLYVINPLAKAIKDFERSQLASFTSIISTNE